MIVGKRATLFMLSALALLSVSSRASALADGALRRPQDNAVSNKSRMAKAKQPKPQAKSSTKAAAHQANYHAVAKASRIRSQIAEQPETLDEPEMVDESIPPRADSQPAMPEEIAGPEFPGYTEYVDDSGWPEPDGRPPFGCTPSLDCDDCGGCCGPSHGPFYARGEYLMWWLTGDRLPPLVTTSPSTTPRAQAGVLGQDSTTILFGNGGVNNTGRSGARVTLGWWLDPDRRIEGEWFLLGDQRATFDRSSDGSTILARPFFNLSTGAPDANVIAYPGQLQGTIRMNAASSFVGTGIHVLENVLVNDYGCGMYRRIDCLYGFRFLGLYDNLTADTSTTAFGTQQPIPPGTVLTTSDAFRTSNNFYGVNIGSSMVNRSARWTLTTIGQLGIGGTREHVSINGNSSITVPGNPTTNSAGGLLAMPTNIGRYRHDAFTVVPQLTLKLGYDLTPNWRITVGYDIIYWSRVARPGEQVNQFINPSQASGQPLVGTPGPLFNFHESDLWIQGVSTGLQWTF